MVYTRRNHIRNAYNTVCRIIIARIHIVIVLDYNLCVFANIIYYYYYSFEPQNIVEIVFDNTSTVVHLYWLLRITRKVYHMDDTHIVSTNFSNAILIPLYNIFTILLYYGISSLTAIKMYLTVLSLFRSLFKLISFIEFRHLCLSTRNRNVVW